jgi:hypothetical protein
LGKSVNEFWEDSFELYESDSTAKGEVEEIIEEAHAAISKLMNKTSKRGKLFRAPKRGAAWQ